MSVSALLPQHGPGVGNKITCISERGTILCGLQRLLYFIQYSCDVCERFASTGPGVGNKITCSSEWGTILCGLRRLLYFI